MDFEGFDPKKLDEYSEQAKILYGKTDAYKEFQQKSQVRTAEQNNSRTAGFIYLTAFNQDVFSIYFLLCHINSYHKYITKCEKKI